MTSQIKEIFSYDDLIDAIEYLGETGRVFPFASGGSIQFQRHENSDRLYAGQAADNFELNDADMEQLHIDLVSINQ
jgi:hypothetical protein